MIFVLFFNGIFVVVMRIFSLVGYIKKSMVFSMFCFWGFRIFLSYVFGYVVVVMVFGFRVLFVEFFGMSLKGVFFGMGMSNFLVVIVVFIWFSRGMWMRCIIEEELKE